MREIFTRRSIRKYDLSKKLGIDELKDICRAGMAAPTAKNGQTWTFVIVDDEALIEKMSSVAKGTMILKNCNTVIVLLGHNDDSVPIKGMQPIDLALAQMNMMTYARSKDLGTCFIGIYPISERMEEMSKILNIPDNYYVFSALAIGYPQDMEEFRELSRYDESKIHHNGF